MKISGLEIAVIAALIIVLGSITFRVIWLAQTNWGEVLSRMTVADWLLTAAVLPILLWLRLKR